MTAKENRFYRTKHKHKHKHKHKNHTMSTRDQIATAALQAFITHGDHHLEFESAGGGKKGEDEALRILCESAYQFADAMINTSIRTSHGTRKTS